MVSACIYSNYRLFPGGLGGIRNPFFGSNGEEGNILLHLHGLGVGNGALNLSLKLALGPKARDTAVSPP